MALETVIIKIKGESKELDSTIKRVQKLGLVDKENAKSFEKTGKKFREQQKKNQQSISGTSKTFSSLGKQIVGAFTVAAVAAFTKKVIETRAEFQKLEAVLTNTLGSNSAAQKALGDIKEFAAKTPFSVLELTQSFVKLANQGFQPTKEEMRKLGDVAASTGKSFDQLTEAIIDAQVGEFERLKEFGIRAQKEGDKVSFTFKGVKEQVDFTEKSIQSYILSLGDAVGVSGAMDAISKTLGGQISNMGDAFDSLLDAIGERGQGIFSSAIGSISDMVVGLESFVKIPVSEKLEEERMGLNLLVLRITDANVSQTERNKLINQLQDDYPDFLGNLNAETASNKQLAERLHQVNEQMINKILVQRKAEEISDAAEKSADRMEQQMEARATLEKELIRVNDKYNLGIDFTNKTLDERTKLTRDALLPLYKELGESQKTGIKRINEEGEAYDRIGNQVVELNIRQERLNEANAEGSELLAEKTQLMEDLGVVIEDVVETIEGTGDTDAPGLSKKQIADAKKAATDLVKQNVELYKQLDQLEIDNITDKRERAKRQAIFEFENKLNALEGDQETIAAITLAAEEKLETDLAAIDIKFDDEKKKRDDKNKKESDANAKKALDDQIARMEQNVAIVAEIQQRASEVFAASTNRKLILIDNEEAKALKALENQGLGEEALAKRKKEIQDEFAKDRAKILRKQAIADKAAALIQIGIDTALGIMKTIGETGFLGLPLAIIIGAMGAAQAAIVAATPIPEFHEGKKPELKDGEMYAKILKSESVIPPEQSKKYKGAIDSMIDKKFENYVFHEYMLPMMKSMSKKDATPYSDVHLWNNQKKQIVLMQESNGLAKAMIKTLDNTNLRRSWK